ncbi:MAG: hypothetical protein H8D45_12630 [Bacteroidetes bacterium]|nr:hypothetical protein [Bacteroidota bacterium]MBL7104458.1 hypothetical protein [Bacteroidales bacterium]
MKFIKIYGERNSGTIYLEWLVKKNLDAEILETYDVGWKHRLAPVSDELTEKIKKDVLFLCLVKNPYSWLLSMHKRPYFHESLRELSFSDFIKYSYGDYRNPVIMWNLKNQSYVDLSNFVEKHEIVRYEDILKDPATIINSMADKYGFKKSIFFKNIQNLLTNKHGMKSRKFHKDFYIKEQWRMKLRTNQINHINEYLDEDLMKKFNYSFV